MNTPHRSGGSVDDEACSGGDAHLLVQVEGCGDQGVEVQDWRCAGCGERVEVEDLLERSGVCYLSVPEARHSLQTGDVSHGQVCEDLFE